MKNLIFALVVLCCSTLQAQTTYIVAHDGSNNAVTDVPAGTPVYFKCENPMSLPIMLYDWAIYHHDAQEWEFLGFGSYQISLTPLDAHDITVYCTTYDMMMVSLDVSYPTDTEWLPPVSIRAVSGGGSFSPFVIPIEVIDVQGRVVPGNSQCVRPGGFWEGASVDTEIREAFTTYGGVSNDFVYEPETPTSVKNSLADTNYTNQTAVLGVLKLPYTVYKRDWITDSWVNSSPQQISVYVRKGSGTNLYTVGPN